MKPAEFQEAIRGFGAHLDMLAALVPMRMFELAAVEWEVLVEHLDTMGCSARHAEAAGPCVGAAQIIGSHADAWMYEPTTPAGRSARRALVDGLAVAALTADGGVWGFAGYHWCGRPHGGCVNPGGRPTVARTAEDPPPHERPARRPTAFMALSALGEGAL